MLSVAKCRSLLPRNGEGLTDPQVERLRDELDAIARVTLEGLGRPGGRSSATAHGVVKLASTEFREQIEERAAIMEFDGGLPRERAERRAISLASHRQPKG